MPSLTPFDDKIPAYLRQVPDRVRVHPLTLSGSTASYKQLPRDVKSATITADADCTIVLSYYDGTTDNPGNLLAGSSSLKIPLKAGVAWSVPQETEFNRIWGVITAGTGTASIEIIPGDGDLNHLIAET